MSPRSFDRATPTGGAHESPPAMRMTRPHLIVLGDVGTGKSTVIRVLQGFAASNGVVIDVYEGLPQSHEKSVDLASAVPLVVWDAVDDARGTLKNYVNRHVKALTAALSSQGGSSKEREALVARLLVLANKSDAQPCPLPEIHALDKKTVFMAGSAAKGTNMLTLWRRVEVYAVPRPNLREVPVRPTAVAMERSISLDHRASEADWYFAAGVGGVGGEPGDLAGRAGG